MEDSQDEDEEMMWPQGRECLKEDTFSEDEIEEAPRTPSLSEKTSFHDKMISRYSDISEGNEEERTDTSAGPILEYSDISEDEGSLNQNIRNSPNIRHQENYSDISSDFEPILERVDSSHIENPQYLISH